MAELIAAYSPPMPAPVSRRKIANAMKLVEQAVRAVETRYTPSVMLNIRLRPSRSVNQPKNNAPETAPAKYELAENPICASDSCKELDLRAPDNAPTSVTSSPSKI